MGQSGVLLCGGGVHGLCQIVGDVLRPGREKLVAKWPMKTDSFRYKLGQVLFTFLCVDFAWIFFRMNSFRNSLGFITRIFTEWDPWVLFDQTLYQLGLGQTEVHILLTAVFILLLVDLIRYKQGITLDCFLEKQCLWFRWGVLFFLFFFILMFGIYGPDFEAKQFIYFQF